MMPQAVMPVPYPRSRVVGRLSRWLRPVRAWALRRSSAYVYQLDDLTTHGAGHEEPLPDGYTLRRATWEDLETCAATAGATLAEYQRRWQQGGWCYAVFCQDRAVHLGWLHFGSVYVRGLGLLIEADSSVCYWYNVVTDPEHRRRGLYRNTLRRVTAMLASQGVQRVTQVVMTANRVPQIALPNLGYHLAQIVRHTSLFGCKATTICDSAGNVVSRRLFFRPPRAVFLI